MLQRLFILLIIILTPLLLAAQANTVTGIIKDAATDKPLAGINVGVTDYSAAITDDKGAFTLKVPAFNAVLSVSGEGYQSKEIALKGRRRITAALHEEAFSSVYDAVPLPYGNRPFHHTAQAVTLVNAPDNWQRPVETPDNYLQGKIPGLQATRRSGTPGTGAWLLLRGFNSLYATNTPLVVVDGMIYDTNEYGNTLISGHVTNPLENIDIKDIDNITVIRDGAAIYGTKGANGVILITTARARELATKIDFVMNSGINQAPAALPVMQAHDYRSYLSDLLGTGGYTQQQVQAMPFMNDDPHHADYYRYHYNTNWQKQVMQNSITQNYYLKITGGDNIARYALSIGYMNAKGIIKNTGLQRYTTRFNADLDLTRRLKASTNLSFTYNEQQLKDLGAAYTTNPLYLSLVKAPFMGIHEVSGEGLESPNLADVDTFNSSNPAVAVNNIQASDRGYRFAGSVKFSYELSPHWQLTSLTGIIYNKQRENLFIPRKGITPDTLANAVAYSRMGSQVQRLFTIYNDTRLSWNRVINGKHRLSVNAGIRFQQGNSESDYGLGFNSATDDLVSVGTGASALRQVGGDLGKWRWLNTYFNTDYTLRNKYFLSLNLAADGSSRFGRQIPQALAINGNKYALLPSVAAAWLLSSERFMSGLPLLEMLKLRISYAVSGNDDIGNYNARQYYVSQNLLGMQGLVRGNIANPALQWESVKKWNFGADLSLFNERLNLSLDAFRHHTDHMLVYEPLNTVAGLKYVLTNNGAMRTFGKELNLSARLVDRTLKWDVNFNIATAINRVTQLPGNSMLTQYAGATLLTVVGAPANLYYGYKTRGIYASDAAAAADGYTKKMDNGSLVPFKGGDVRFTDRNGDKRIDENDRETIGNPNPDFTGAWGTRLAWKRWALDALFTFSKGNDIYNQTRARLEAMQGPENQTLHVRNRWRTEGQVTDVPRAVWGDPMGNSRFSDRWIEEGSYLRLRHISLTCNLPFKPGFVKYATAYATAANLFTITGYKGYDPEFSAANSIFARGIDTGLEPQFRSILLGLRLGL